MNKVDQCDDRIEIERIDPLADPRWDGLVMKHPGHSVFHLGAWARVLHGTYGHRPHYLRFVRGGMTVALVPVMEVRGLMKGLRGVSLPFSDCCEPLLFDGWDGCSLSGHLAGVAKERGWKFLEVRGGAQCAAPAPSASSEGGAFLGHELDLQEDSKRQFSRCEASTRRAVRKAERAGLIASVSTSCEAVEEFYRLHERTRRRHGLPPQPISFFRAIHRELIEPGNGFVVGVKGKDGPVAAAVFLLSGRTGIYKFGASDREAWDLRPNNLAMWRGIEALIERGCNTLHFGRTDRSHEGLRRFKRSWGAREFRLDYARWGSADRTWVPVNPASPGVHEAVFRRLPLALNRLAGKLIYPQLD